MTGSEPTFTNLELAEQFFTIKELLYRISWKSITV